MGNTGYAENTHLHYEVIINDNKVDPVEYTYASHEQTISEDTIKIIKTLETKEPETKEENPNKQIQELQDKISLQTKEIEALKQELQEASEYKFTYPVQKTSKYEIKLNEGETLYIK